MPLAGLIGNGVKVGFSTTSPVSWTRVGQLLNVDIPQPMRDKIDSTVHSTGGFKSSFGGLKDVPDMTMTLLSDHETATSPSHATLATLSDAGTKVWWRVELPVSRDLSTTLYKALEFEGSVAQFGYTAPIADRQETTVAVRFEGTSFTRYAPAASAIS